MKKLWYDLKMAYRLFKRKRRTKERWGQMIVNIVPKTEVIKSNMFYSDSYLIRSIKFENLDKTIGGK